MPKEVSWSMEKVLFNKRKLNQQLISINFSMKTELTLHLHVTLIEDLKYSNAFCPIRIRIFIFIPKRKLPQTYKLISSRVMSRSNKG